MKKLALLAAVVGLTACEPVVTETSTPTKPAPSTPAATPAPAAVKAPPKVSASRARSNFAAVVRQVEPVAERECKRRAPDLNCDFKIIVESNPKLPPNAYQTLDRAGRPIVGFTLALIQDARNRDEIAFVLGHEAAHHIERHLEQQRQNAQAGALVTGVLAGALGLDVNTGAQIGGAIGARAYSKKNELEADALGTVISKRAGYDPVRGAAFFSRIPDPGDKFLGTHPPNAARVETVRRVNAQL